MANKITLSGELEADVITTKVDGENGTVGDFMLTQTEYNSLKERLETPPTPTETS